MTRSIKLLAVTCLAIVLALSSAQSAFSSQWIIYDNGSPGGPLDEPFVGVVFSLPTGVSSARLLAVSFYWRVPNPSIQGSGMLMSIQPARYPDATVHVTGFPPGTDLITPISILNAVPGWNTVDVSASNLIVSGDFFVVIEQPVSDTVCYDSSAPNFEDRSIFGDSLAGVLDNDCCGLGGSHNLMIRAEIDPITSPTAPVGGFMQPVNKLTVFAPYLALFGVVGAVAIIVSKKGYLAHAGTLDAEKKRS